GERAEMLASMESGAARLRRMLDDLLTASRLDAGAVEFALETVAVADLVASAVVRARTAHADAEIVADVPADMMVRVDADRIGQALDNLVGNAIRHGASPIALSVAASGDMAEIRVSDAGAGVSEAMQGRLFQRFATSVGGSGTGLGLFIVRELARAHGGDAWYEPPTAGGGAGCF